VTQLPLTQINYNQANTLWASHTHPWPRGGSPISLVAPSLLSG
jgi:hypothetical protein